MNAATNTPPQAYPQLPLVAGAAAIPTRSGVPNGTPDPPMMMQSQVAGRVPLGCAGCQLKGITTWPRWAKVLTTFGVLGAGIMIVILAMRRGQ